MKQNATKKLLQIFVLMALAIMVICINAKSQTAVTAATTSYITANSGTTYTANGALGSPVTAIAYTYNYGNVSGTANNDKQVINFTAGGTVFTFLPISGQTVKMRRVNNAVVSGIRNLKFDEGNVTGNTINVAGSYDDDMEHFFIGNQGFNSGTDNLFANQGDGNGNNNNIERVDVIYSTGLTATDNSKVGFAIFERGTTTAHDPVKVALILGVDVAGNPTAYSSILSITSATYGTTDVVPSLNYIISRRDNATEPNLRMSTTTNQAIGGVFFKFSDFGIANNTRVYGYSVIPNDFTGTTSAQIINYTDSVLYPKNTSSATGAGGIDLVSFTGIAQAIPVIVSYPISGTVFSDANGLSDLTVNGIGTNVSNTLYVQLVNSSNAVVATVAVNNDGTYSFPPQIPGTYSVVLTSSATATTTASLPGGYVNTGENIGITAGNDGFTNGIISNIIVTNAAIVNVNFGIEQPPAASSITAPLDVNPGGSFQVIVPVLTGYDPEQGTFSGTGNADTIQIVTLPVNGTLYYNGVAVTAGQIIPNYNPDLLTVDPNDGAVNVTFTFSEIDAAQQVSIPATVSIPFQLNPTTLPVTLLSFSAQPQGKNVLIKWVTTQSVDGNKYDVLFSSTGRNFNAIASLPASANQKEYNAMHLFPVDGFNFYRLKITDKNGKVTYSEIRIVMVGKNNVVSVFPVPATNFINVMVTQELISQPAIVKLVAMDGRVVFTKYYSSINQTETINVSAFTRGKYIILINGKNVDFAKQLEIY